MPDSLKVRLDGWEWLRLMKEMDPKEKPLPSSVASPSGATQLTTTQCEPPYARFGWVLKGRYASVHSARRRLRAAMRSARWRG